MKKDILLIKNIFIISFLAFVLLQASTVVLAADPCASSITVNGNAQPNPDYNPSKCSGGGSSSGSSGAAPAGSPVALFLNFLNNIIYFLMLIGIAIAVLLLVVAGFYFVTARGDNSKLEKARAVVLWVIIGLLVILLAKFLIGTVTQMVMGGSGYSSPSLVSPCQPNAVTKCEGNSAYYFDSCGAKGSLSEKCTSSQECSSGVCVDKFETNN